VSTGRAATGRTVISARAIERVVRAVTAEEFGVQARAVSADLTDDAGRLDLAVRTAIRVVPIRRVGEDAGAIDRSGGSIVERAQRGEAAIAGRVADITGSTVSRLSLRFTAADIAPERRVR
jgi:hypothetical protein